MGWLSDLFRRGDLAAANLAVSDAIAQDERPDLERIAAETGVGTPKVAAIAREAVAADLRRKVAGGIAASSVSVDAIYDRAVAMGLAARPPRA